MNVLCFSDNFQRHGESDSIYNWSRSLQCPMYTSTKSGKHTSFVRTDYDVTVIKSGTLHTVCKDFDVLFLGGPVDSSIHADRDGFIADLGKVNIPIFSRLSSPYYYTSKKMRPYVDGLTALENFGGFVCWNHMVDRKDNHLIPSDIQYTVIPNPRPDINWESVRKLIKRKVYGKNKFIVSTRFSQDKMIHKIFACAEIFKEQVGKHPDIKIFGISYNDLYFKAMIEKFPRQVMHMVATPGYLNSGLDFIHYDANFSIDASPSYRYCGSFQNSQVVAFLHGCVPVIAPGGVPKGAEGTCVEMKSDSAEGIANSLVCATKLSKSERWKMAFAGASFIKKRRSPKRAVSKLKRFFSDVMKEM